MAALSIIVPSTGRETLAATLRSVCGQLGRLDEVLVCGDLGDGVAIVREFPTVQHISCARGQNFGASERMAGIAAARTSHLAFLDDDDVYLPGAGAAIHQASAHHPARPILCGMLRNGDVLWRGPKLVYANVSSSMIVFSNNRRMLGTWTDRYECDF